MRRWSEESGLEQLAEALELWRELGDAPSEALTLEAMGWAHVMLGDYDSARRGFDESLRLWRTLADERMAARPLLGLCQVVVAEGDVDAAEPIAEELYATDDKRTQQIALHFLADCPLIRQDFDEAERRYARSIVHARGHGFPTMCPEELRGVAMSASGQGDYERAVRLAAAAEARFEALGVAVSYPFWDRLQQWYVGGARAELGSEAAAEAEAAGRGADFEAVLDEVVEAAASVHERGSA